MRTAIACMLMLLPLAAAAANLDGWINAQTGGDSLAPMPGTVEAGGLLRGDGWTVLVHEKYSANDTTGVVDRILGSYISTGVDASLRTGPLRFNPDLLWTVDFDSGRHDLVLPAQGGVARRKGYVRPGLGIEADVLQELSLFASGHYWNRDIVHEEGYDVDWTDYRLGGGATWTAPWNSSLTVAGLTSGTKADPIDYESSWSRMDLRVALHPASLPRNTYFSGDITYSLYDGRDFMDNRLADRLTSRLRLVRMELVPSVSVNTTFESVIDIDDGTLRSACTSLGSRLVWRFRRDAEVPSTVILSGKLTRSSIRTERAGVFSRVNVYRGLSLLVDAEARVVPTSTAGAGPDRIRYVFGPGLEYRFRNNVRIWGVIEQERTNLERNENWWRVRSGLEFYPGSTGF